MSPACAVLLGHKTDQLEEEIAQRQCVEDELRKARDDAEAANRAKSEFLANMSHELRTPLNGVIGMTDLLISTELNPKQLHFARTAKSSADVLLRLINDILDLSKVEAGKLELEHLDFRLTEAVESVNDLMSHKALERKLEISYYLDPTIPEHLCGDSRRLQQILINLVSNAIKFTQEGGVVVRAALVREEQNEVLTRFTVEDTGIGIPADRLNRLFRPFSQVDASTTRKYGGTGLGLRISKQLTDLMGGQIGVQSVEGKGTTFWFTVPLRKAKTSVSPSPRRINPEELKNLRVLIVDDNATNRNILIEQLSGWGLNVGAAADGLTALLTLRQARVSDRGFDLVLVDMQMPGMNGAQLAEAIRSETALAAIPLILLSSGVDDGALEHARRVEHVPFVVEG